MRPPNASMRRGMDVHSLRLLCPARAYAEALLKFQVWQFFQHYGCISPLATCACECCVGGWAATCGKLVTRRG